MCRYGSKRKVRTVLAECFNVVNIHFLHIGIILTRKLVAGNLPMYRFVSFYCTFYLVKPTALYPANHPFFCKQ